MALTCFNSEKIINLSMVKNIDKDICTCAIIMGTHGLSKWYQHVCQ